MEEKKILKNIFIKELRNKEDFEKIINLIKKYKIIEECYQKAQHYIDLASNSLTVFKDSQEKEILKNLTSFSLSRYF
jgi:Geranylgeranyl pyrophosphate synthase